MRIAGGTIFLCERAAFSNESVLVRSQHYITMPQKKEEHLGRDFLVDFLCLVQPSPSDCQPTSVDGFIEM
jgi:hypothetical protein